MATFLIVLSTPSIRSSGSTTESYESEMRKKVRVLLLKPAKNIGDPGATFSASSVPAVSEL